MSQGRKFEIVEPRITTRKEFEAERSRWEQLYRADPRGQIFLSWEWLHAYLRIAGRGWTILLVRDGETLVAALPIKVRGVPSALLPIARELAFLTEPVADYQGMLCLPGRENEVVDAFSRAIGRLHWDRATLRDLHDSRVVDVLERLRSAGNELAVTG